MYSLTYYLTSTGDTRVYTAYAYDVLGRTIQVLLADSASSTKYVYQGSFTAVTDPADNPSRVPSDRLTPWHAPKGFKGLRKYRPEVYNRLPDEPKSFGRSVRRHERLRPRLCMRVWTNHDAIPWLVWRPTLDKHLVVTSTITFGL